MYVLLSNETKFTMQTRPNIPNVRLRFKEHTVVSVKMVTYYLCRGFTKFSIGQDGIIM